ncbi:hypothetical protein EGH10_11135 [Brevibacillus laterosporus]|nr:hypothetical protein DM460_11985 [Brevibacillus laterosporus]TPH11184.1 hypothetical protein EGH10_11135 [Brevibacillus laterosporus]HAS02090.1 hypothetical protein [Brevibacillus sp.]
MGQMLQRKFFKKKQVCKQKILYALSVMIHKSLTNSSEQSFGKKFNKKNLISLTHILGLAIISHNNYFQTIHMTL